MDKKDENIDQKKVIIYVGYVYDIGGIESWIYYMCQNLYSYYNILLLFDSGNIIQLKRYNKYVEVEHRNRDKQYECDTLLIASNWAEFPKNIKYKKCITTIHSDYKYFNEQLRSNLTVVKQANEINELRMKHSEARKAMADEIAAEKDNRKAIEKISDID